MFVASGFENSHAYFVVVQWLCENWKKPIGLPPMYLVLAPIIFGFAVYIKEQPLYFRGNIVAMLKFWFANWFASNLFGCGSNYLTFRGYC